ncbi:MAG: FixH family protein, partial [Hyphomicrobiaceae bacterium]
MTPTKSEPMTLRGSHVLAGVLLFFGVIFAVNGVFLVSALRTHTGVVSKQPYRKGLEYNQRIAADEQQKSIGWQDTLEVSPDRKHLRLIVNDKDGNAVSNLSVTGFLGRPATGRYDRPLTFAATANASAYEAPLDELPAGNWLVELTARKT